ncbi:hypothetical protein PMIN01_11883 [Paraphaeosphaeria minitans]|uniref:Uncharacterized protein n=1 Tax=Paraphaeosphaeria minitans TaxID=565426 RepID=A0A9P6G8V5_9PLEO|nr:hypothetical protein PMIN01_11883 [Paraphaeosphaeria minitans]
MRKRRVPNEEQEASSARKRRATSPTRHAPIRNRPKPRATARQTPKAHATNPKTITTPSNLLPLPLKETIESEAYQELQVLGVEKAKVISNLVARFTVKKDAFLHKQQDCPSTPPSNYGPTQDDYDRTKAAAELAIGKTGHKSRLHILFFAHGIQRMDLPQQDESRRGVGDQSKRFAAIAKDLGGKLVKDDEKTLEITENKVKVLYWRKQAWLSLATKCGLGCLLDEGFTTE